MKKKNVAVEAQAVEKPVTEQKEKQQTKRKANSPAKKVVIDESEINEQVKQSKEAIGEKCICKKETFWTKLAKLKLRFLNWLRK